MSKRRPKLRQADRRRRQQAEAKASATPAAEASTTGNGRNAGGRFVSGNRAAAGPRVARPTTSYSRALRMAVTPDELAEVGRALLEKAVAGDVKAARLLFQYLLPAPAQHLTIDNQFHDPDQSLTTEFRRAGATWKQIDEEFLDHLQKLIEAQNQYEAATEADQRERYGADMNRHLEAMQ